MKNLWDFSFDGVIGDTLIYICNIGSSDEEEMGVFLRGRIKV